MSDPLHIMGVLRCPVCRSRNAARLDPASGLMECWTCGQASLPLDEPAPTVSVPTAQAAAPAAGTSPTGAATPARRTCKSTRSAAK